MRFFVHWRGRNERKIYRRCVDGGDDGTVAAANGESPAAESIGGAGTTASSGAALDRRS